MSSNLVRTLHLLETLSDISESGISTPEILEHANITPSTLYRLMAEMEESGYLYRGHDRRLHPNFSFERRISMGAASPAQLSNACAEISAKLQAAAEIVLLRGHNLLWHITNEHPLQPIRLRAHPGYVRATYELDSISRMALAHLPIADIERSWNTTGFFDVGVTGAKVTWQEAQEKLAATDTNLMQYDMTGNAKGVRRYCVAVTDENQNFVCLLTAAEAATPLRDEEAHVARIRDALMQAKANLESIDPEEVTDKGDK
jgi:DNA-binding IclR family transcriptional regulator